MMKKTTLTALVAASIFAASAAVTSLAQKSVDARATQPTDARSKEADAHHTVEGGMNHADCPLMREGESSKSQHDAHHTSLDERGARAMGFSQTATAHHFLLKPDGGVIQVEVKDAADTANRDLVRQHLSHVARLFAEGDFDTPALVHGRTPPGAEALRRLKSEISYTYEETETGGRVRISTKNAEALAAVHDFLRFQIEDHRTGDPLN
jgi:hypothetical protein